MKVPRVTLGDVAQAAGLSRSGASRALNNDPRVPPLTCQRVQKVAAQMGYRPDPELSSALRLLRQRRSERYVETLAFFSWHDRPIEQGGNHYTKRVFAGARSHADALGYRLEEYWLNSPGMTARRLQTILAARGIRGCILGPTTEDISRFAFDWKRFSVVAVTGAFENVALDRARPSNFDNARLALNETHRLGYRRIGLLVDDYIHIRSSHGIRAAYLDDQYSQAAPGLPILETVGLGSDPGMECLKTDQFDRFVTWFKDTKPEVILSSRNIFFQWLQKADIKTPHEVGFVSLEGVDEGQTQSHIDQHPHLVGAAGIDILVSKLSHRDHNVSRQSIVVNVPGTWVAGDTTQNLS